MGPDWQSMEQRCGPVTVRTTIMPFDEVTWPGPYVSVQRHLTLHQAIGVL
jgi:hypothetical protein